MGDPVQDQIKLLNTAERRTLVMEKRREGKTYRMIANEIEEEFGIDRLPNGWGPRYAHQDISRELDKYRNELRENVEFVVELQVQRIEEMVRGLYPKARNGDEEAVAEIRQLMKRKADLLGLDEADEYILSTGEDGFKFEWADPEDAPNARPHSSEDEADEGTDG